MTFKMT